MNMNMMFKNRMTMIKFMNMKRMTMNDYEQYE